MVRTVGRRLALWAGPLLGCTVAVGLTLFFVLIFWAESLHD